MFAVVLSPAILGMSLFITFGYYIYVYQQVFEQKPLWIGVLKSILAAIVAYTLASLLLMTLLFLYFTYIAPNPDVLVLLRPQ
ncbi:MAG: hypothetical protein AAGG75_28085 [Bacteroidota bacterium]